MRLPRRRWLVAACLVVAGCCGWWWCRTSQRGWTVDKLEGLLRTELPAGCDRQTAEAWFRRHGIPVNWWQEQEYTAEVLRGRETKPGIAGLRSGDLSGMLRGDIEGPEANVSAIWTGRIYVYLFFDRRGRLVGHLVDPLAYAL